MGTLGVKDLVVVGAGPAGLMAACTAAARGLSVLLLEKNASAGKKLLLSGGGRGNFTHAATRAELSSAFPDLAQGRFLKPAFSALDSEGLRAWFSARGLASRVEASGKLFPVSGRAADLLSALNLECESAGVEMRFGAQVKALRALSSSASRFLITLADGSEFHAQSVLLACGGSTFKFTGSEGEGYRLARSLGHRISSLGAALQSVALQDSVFFELSGLSLDDVVLSLPGVRAYGSKRAVFSRGELLFTHFGLSGPAALNLSRWLLDEAAVSLQIDFLPAVSRAELNEDFSSYLRRYPNRLAKSFVLEKLPLRLAELLAVRIWPLASASKSMAHVTKAERSLLTDALKALVLSLAPPRPFDQGMATRGGLVLSEVQPKTMESRLCPGLYFAGELLDIDGPSGGYNLQAAFSTGYLVGKSVSG